MAVVAEVLSVGSRFECLLYFAIQLHTSYNLTGSSVSIAVEVITYLYFCNAFEAVIGHDLMEGPVLAG